MSIDNEIDRDTHDHDLTYENEQSRDLSPMVRVSLKEYNDLRDQAKDAGKYITDPALISIINHRCIYGILVTRR